MGEKRVIVAVLVEVIVPKAVAADRVADCVGDAVRYLRVDGEVTGVEKATAIGVENLQATPAEGEKGD